MDTNSFNEIAPGTRSAARPIIRGQSGVISTGHHLAAEAGYEMMRNGGNAVDAGVAAGLVVNVVHHDMTSFGGVAPIILYSAEDQQVHTISGLGRWPKKASREYFEENHDGEIPWGIQRSVVPAAADAWLTALKQHGTLPVDEVASPAIRIARNGYPMYEFQYENIKEGKDKYLDYESTAEVFLSNGEVPDVGTIITQKDLANTLERMVEAGEGKDRESAVQAARDYFYNGPIADRIGEFSEAHGGLMRTSDLNEFTVQTEDPVHIEYKGLDIYTCGPWCQGPVFAQALKILEQFDLQEMGHNSPEYLHTILEVLKLSYSDREWYYGDPDFVDVPIEELVSETYAKRRAGVVSPDNVIRDIAEPGKTDSKKPQPYDLSHLKTDPGDSSLFHQDTSYVAAMDAEGNIFSATPSDGCGGTPIIPGLGIPMSSRGKQTRLDPRHPNRLEPWKRPRLTPNPALVLKDGEPFMAIGTPGGDVQPQAMLQVFLNQIEFGMNPQQAIEVPRVATYNFPATSSPHNYFPGVSSAENRLSQGVFEELEDLGHRMQTWRRSFRAGGVNIVRRDPETGLIEGGADPRRENYALGE